MEISIFVIDDDLQIMKDFIRGCLDLADKQSLKSMALPAVGTGNLEFPRNYVAKTMITIVQEFSKDNPQTTLRDIRFILYDKDVETVKVVILCDVYSNVFLFIGNMNYIN